MFFSFYSKKLDFTGELLYVQNDHSLIYTPVNNNIGVGILFGSTTELGTICETCEVVTLSGYAPKTSWLRKKINLPKAKKGCLLAHFDDPPLKGTCIDYASYWDTYYDEEKQVICIGDYQIHGDDDCVEFANNTIATLRNGDLIAIWAKFNEI